jgi:hypothetical protein
LVTRTGSLGLLAMSASTSVALARLITHGLSARVMIPLVVAIVVADVVTTVSIRIRVPVVLAIALGGVAAALSLLGCVDPSLFDPSSPYFASSTLLSGQLRAARYALANDGTPLPLLNGVVVAVGAMGGGAAAITRGLWTLRLRYARGASGPVWLLWPCIAPSLALFLYSSLVSAEQGRLAAALAYVLGVLLFVMLADRGASLTASPQSVRAPRPDVIAILGGLLTLVVLIGSGIGLSGMRLTVFHVTPPSSIAPGQTSASGGSQNLLSGLALVDSLLTTEIQESNVVVFRAHSSVPTYWQVGTLSTFNGTAWLPTSGVNNALAGSSRATGAALGPTALPSPSSGTTFSARVGITDFVSRLLPAPPHTIAVQGLAGATSVGDEGVLASVSSGPGTTYTVTARLPVTATAGGRQLAPNDPRLAPYLALPTQPAVISKLAHQAVGSATTVAAKAQALVNWFRSGQFRYTLDPPPTNGPDPLVQFLTVTKAGYCQQFAGAYGVLARSLGIPTRLVVGFTSGQPGPGGSYTVTGADAHVWPQVYLGPDTGWVSVEPTPPSASGAPIPAGVLEPTGAPSTGGATVTPSTGPAQGSSRVGDHRPHHASPTPSGGFGIWVLAGALIGLLALAALGVVLLRRRSSDDAHLHPDERVVRSWERAQRALRRRGLPRRGDETPAEYAARLRSLEHRPARALRSDSLESLAALVELACYAPRPCTAEQAERAGTLATTVVEANRRGRTLAGSVSR